MNRRSLLLLAAVPSIAHAHSYRLGNIAIGHAWALPASHPDGQVFVPLVNQGAEPDALVFARSTLCSLIELRRNARYDDPPATRFDLLPGKPLPMRPSARHLRLVGLTQPLKPGDKFALILDFEQAGETEIDVHVEETPGN